MNDINKVLAAADETYLTALSNKGIYKRAYKDIDGMALISHEIENGISVEISGETVTVTAPLENCKCSCVSRTVCRHIVGAILLLRQTLTEEDFADAYIESEKKEKVKETSETEETPAEESSVQVPIKLTEREIQKINRCSESCLELLGDVLRNGIVRLPDAVSDKAEVMAVRCHALKMADGERAVRDIGSRLGDYLSHRASFSIDLFMEKFCNCIRLMEDLSANDITADILGNFRNSYEKYPEDLTLMPIGQRKVSGGGYEGEVYYFFNMKSSENQFMSLSDVRPTFYDTKTRRSRGTFPWGMTASLSTMMRRSFVIANAKVSEGRLSSSQETKVVMTKDCNLNCKEIQSQIYCDLRQAAVELYEKNPQTELERLMFVHPKKCICSEFDKIAQTYSLTIEDGSGTYAYIRVKYREESKKLVELVEKVGEKMIKSPQSKYTILALGNIEKGELVLYPIEIYDFIEPPYYEEYELSEEYVLSAENLSYSRQMYELLADIEDNLKLVLQCGLLTGSEKFRKLENISFNYGMKGLSRLCEDFGRLSESYRHNAHADVKEILHKMAELEQYILTAKKRLEIILTLNRRTEK